MSAIQDRIKHIEALARNAFKDHKITLKYSSPSGEMKQWLCKKPEESAYWFHITVWPYTLCITGDLGDLIVERSPNMIEWCRRSIDSMDYFSEKVSREIKTQEFDRDVALENLDYQHKLGKEYAKLDWDEKKKYSEQLEELQELKDLLDDDIAPDEFYRAYYESSFYGGDMIECNNFTFHFLWCREAIKWFLNNLKD